ncbi:MAG TPA: T9SS type A sorting domain-containing protein [Bacteroidota bacterium]|nr:T9SS type A sorting domain-containing protein [Bacteroidota bacterium]
MKRLYCAILCLLFTPYLTSAQGFDEATIVAGQLGPFATPYAAGASLKATYPGLFNDWHNASGHPMEVVNINNIYPGQGNALHLQLPSNAGYMIFGPLQGGSFLFTLLRSTVFPSQNPSHGQCHVVVLDANMTQVGTTQTFQATRNAPIQFCFVQTAVPAGGYVRFEGQTGSYYVDDIGAGGGPTPVELVSFNARYLNEQVELNWRTATELNNYGFAIERSRDGALWEEIDLVPGAGNSFSPRNYVYTDKLEGDLRNATRLSYRLRQIDRDGTTEYSRIVVVNTGALPSGVELYAAYPNPFNPSTTVSFSLTEALPVTVKVYNMFGQEVVTLLDNANTVAGFHTVGFQGNNLPSGSYTVTLQAGATVRHQRILLSK